MKIKILRVVLCIVLAVSCFMLQSNFTRIIPILTAAPNLLLIVTFSVGFLKGRMWGMLTGLGCGLLLDSFSGGVLGYYTLIFIYIGYFNGIFTRVLAHDMVVMPVLLCSANELIYSVYIYVFRFLLFGRVNIADYIKNLALPELLMTAIATIIVYGVIMTVDRHLTEAEKKGEKRFA
mgnify:FL=1